MNNNNEQAAYETWRNSLPNGSLDVTPAQAWRARAEKVVEQEPVAWLHDTDGRVDVIHSQVKQLWLKMGQPNGFYREKVPCRVEHYTIPLYAHPQPSADDALMVDINPPALTENLVGVKTWIDEKGVFHCESITAKDFYKP